MKQLKTQVLSPRQQLILDFFKTNSELGNKVILEKLVHQYGTLSRITVIRDLEHLIRLKLIKKTGKGRNVSYLLLNKHPLLDYYEPNIYFHTETDERKDIYQQFQFNVLDRLDGLFDQDELQVLESWNSHYLQKTAKMAQSLVKKEQERLSIDLSWKSSRIEGNTYSLLETENLIKEKMEAKGRRHSEAVMILNHKKTIDYFFQKPKDYQKLSLLKIVSVHDLIAGDLSIDLGLRKSAVGITGTRYLPLDNLHQIKDAMEKLVKMLNLIKSPFNRALAAVLALSYIQPFNDGNKRTARMMGNAILIANGICPLSYRSVSEEEYKKALILFYEKNSALYFKTLFKEQFKFAIENYF